MWRGPALSDSRRSHARVFEWSDDSQIDCAYVVLPLAKTSPRRQRIPHPSQPKGARKIVSTSLRHDQHRQSKPYHLAEMAVDGSVTTKNQNHFGLIGDRRHPNAPIDARINLKRLEILLRTSQPKDNGSAHVRG
jgi:hypothetical protein